MELRQITGKRPRSQRLTKKPKASEQKTRAIKQPAVHKRLKKSTSQEASPVPETRQASPVPEARQASPAPEARQASPAPEARQASPAPEAR